MNAPSPPRQRGTKRGAEDEDDEEGRVKRQRQDSAAPPASTPPPPPPSPPSPQGPKRKSGDEGGRASKQRKTDGTAAERLESLTVLLFKLEDRRDLVAAKYQDLPLRVRRDVRHLHALEQFVLAALLQHVHTPYGAAALPDVEAEMPIAELCPSDDLLREAKLAVGEAVAMGGELTYGCYRKALELLEAAPHRLKTIEAMVSRLKRSYAESTTGVSERALLLAWNVACQRIQQDGDITAGIEGGKQFLGQWEALDDFVATKYEERRYFSCDAVSLFGTNARPVETTDFDTDEQTDEESQQETDGGTESAQKEAEEKTEEPARYHPPPFEAPKPATKAATTRTKADITEANWAQYQLKEAEKQAASRKVQEEKRKAYEEKKRKESGSRPNTPHPTLLNTIFLPPPTLNTGVGLPQSTPEEYENAWKAMSKPNCTISELPIPLTTNHISTLREGLRRQIRASYDATPAPMAPHRARLTACANLARDGWLDEDIVKLRAQMFVARGQGMRFRLQEGEAHLITGKMKHSHGKLVLIPKDGQSKAQFKEQLSAFKRHLVQNEFPRWYEDKIDGRTECKHLEKERRTSQVVIFKAIYNGVSVMKEHVDDLLRQP